MYLFDQWRLGIAMVVNSLVAILLIIRNAVVDDETRRSYLERAYKLGKEFAQS